LAEETGLSVRTIQRLESGESLAKGHTLQSLKKVFGEDFQSQQGIPDQIRIMNMLCMSFLFIPFGNLIFPAILWFKHRGDERVDELGRILLNFQITWYLAASLAAVLFVLIQPFLDFNLIFWGMIVFGVHNVTMILRAAYRIKNDNWHIYPKSIKLL